jgi:hypothetical protein
LLHNIQLAKANASIIEIAAPFDLETLVAAALPAPKVSRLIVPDTTVYVKPPPELALATSRTPRAVLTSCFFQRLHASGIEA